MENIEERSPLFPLLSCQRASRQEVDTSPDVSNYKKYKQTVGQTWNGEITQAGGKKRLLVCPLKLQRQKQEAIPYPKTTTTTVEASRKLVVTSDKHSFEGAISREKGGQRSDMGLTSQQPRRRWGGPGYGAETKQGRGLIF